MAVVEVAVPADPAERGARVILARLGPAGEAGDVGPGASRARLDVHRQSERVLAEGLVPDRPVSLRDPDVVVADEVEDVGQDAAIEPGPGLSGDGHPAAAARERPDAANRPGRAIVHALAAEVE